MKSFGEIEKNGRLISKYSEIANAFADRMETIFGDDPNSGFNPLYVLKEKIDKFIKKLITRKIL